MNFNGLPFGAARCVTMDIDRADLKALIAEHETRYGGHNEYNGEMERILEDLHGLLNKPPKKLSKEIPVCKYCGSKNVLKDAFAEWSEYSDSWVLYGTYDDETCPDCDRTGNVIDWVPVEESKE